VDVLAHGVDASQRFDDTIAEVVRVRTRESKAPNARDSTDGTQ
jgi:hypothetical protein